MRPQDQRQDKVACSQLPKGPHSWVRATWRTASTASSFRLSCASLHHPSLPSSLPWASVNGHAPSSPRTRSQAFLCLRISLHPPRYTIYPNPYIFFFFFSCPHSPLDPDLTVVWSGLPSLTSPQTRAVLPDPAARVFICIHICIHGISTSLPCPHLYLYPWSVNVHISACVLMSVVLLAVCLCAHIHARASLHTVPRDAYHSCPYLHTRVDSHLADYRLPH